MSTISQKICLVGDFGVGKTSLIRRFVDRQFSDAYLSTVGVKISRKTLALSNSLPDLSSRQVNLLIWDIEGSTQFKSIAPSYLQGAKGAIIVGDLTRPDTLKALQGHVESFAKVNPQGRIVVAFNKADLVAVEQNSSHSLQDSKQNSPAAWVRHQNIVSTYLTSAKTGDNVDLIFECLVNA
jgi:small GTP-binding protein